jgi:hypothetical protein
MSKEVKDLNVEKMRECFKKDLIESISNKKDLSPQLAIIIGVDSKEGQPYLHWCGNEVFVENIKFESFYGMVANLFFGHIEKINEASEVEIKPCILN